jgi:hypothetical protein
MTLDAGELLGTVSTKTVVSKSDVSRICADLRGGPEAG